MNLYFTNVDIPFDEIGVVIPAGSKIVPMQTTSFPDGQIRSLDAATEYGTLTVWNPRTFNVECPDFNEYLKQVFND